MLGNGRRVQALTMGLADYISGEDLAREADGNPDAAISSGKTASEEWLGQGCGVVSRKNHSVPADVMEGGGSAC